VTRALRLVGVVALVILAGCGTGAAVGSAVAHLLLPLGPQTATIRVTIGTPGTPKFSGSIAGEALNGVYSAGSPTLPAKLCPGMPVTGPDAAVFTYSGSYGGTAYSFSGCLDTSTKTKVKNPNTVPPDAVLTVGTLRITGHVGAEAVVGSANWNVATGSDPAKVAPTFSFPFSGTVGTESLHGTATLQEAPGGGIVLTANLAVN
jgi:hypothetical protein